MSKDDGAWNPGDPVAGIDVVVGDYDMTGGTNGLYAGPPPWLNSVGGAMVANTLYFVPIILPYDRVITDILVQITAAVVGNGRVGLYEMRADSMLPGLLLVDAGTFDTNVTHTDRRLTVNLTLEAGIYLAATVFDAAANVRRVSGNQGIGPYRPFSNGASSGTGTVTGFERAFTYGALPADESGVAATSYTISSPPLVFVK